MRLLLISDIHANLPALEAVIKEAKKVGFDAVYCAGDIVGYYPWPNEVTKWVEENVKECVMGNHDAIIAGIVPPDYFSSAAYEAIIWTLKELTEDNKRFISQLPFYRKFDGTFLVHDTPLQPMSMYYILTPEDALEVFRQTDYQITIFGHTHIPVLYAYNGKELRVVYDMDGFELKNGYRYLINPGSVGQPRDGIPLASFLIWDTENGKLIHRRVDFDKERVLKEVLKKGLPEVLGYRLFKGY